MAGQKVTKPAQSAKKSRGTKRNQSVSEYDDEADESPQSQDSQGSTDQQIRKLAEEMKRASKKRREGRYKKREAELETRSEDMEKSIHNAFKAQSTDDVMKGYIERLRLLIQKRVAIEEKLILHIAKLEKAYTSVNAELSVTLDGRAEDIKEMLKTMVSTGF